MRREARGRIWYDEPFTHDILPMSSSGAYFVAGELVASTMIAAEHRLPR